MEKKYTNKDCEHRAIVYDKSGLVVNVIQIAKGADWEPPEGCFYAHSENGNIGDKFVDGVIVRELSQEDEMFLMRQRQRADYPKDAKGVDEI